MIKKSDLLLITAQQETEETRALEVIIDGALARNFVPSRDLTVVDLKESPSARARLFIIRKYTTEGGWASVKFDFGRDGSWVEFR